MTFEQLAQAFREGKIIRDGFGIDYRLVKKTLEFGEGEREVYYEVQQRNPVRLVWSKMRSVPWAQLMQNDWSLYEGELK